MIIEGIAVTIDDIERLKQAGIDRIELVSAIIEGGLTPSYALIKEAVKRAEHIPVQVMIRPHAYSFTYTSDEINLMCEDIKAVKQLGANGIVIGCLTPDRQIDHTALATLLKAAEHLDITFHRAFDELDDQINGLKQLLQYSTIKRILTSGGAKTAPEATQQLAHLVKLIPFPSSLSIMGGSGLTANNITSFVTQSQVHEVHFGSGIREHHSFNHPVDIKTINHIKHILH